MIFEGVVIMAVNVLITAMVGRLGAVQLAAVGLATMMQFSAAMIFAAAGTGAGAIVARETGACNWQEVRKIPGKLFYWGVYWESCWRYLDW